MNLVIQVDSTLSGGSLAISDNAYGYYVIECLLDGENTLDLDMTVQDLEELVNKLSMLILQHKRDRNNENI